MALPDESILKMKLKDWVLNAHLPVVLEVEDTKELREQLDLLVMLGVVERDGARRGVKYRWANREEIAQLEIESTDPCTLSSYREVKRRNTSCTKQASFSELLEWVIGSDVSQDRSASSITLAIKKTYDGGGQVIAYMGADKIMTREFKSAKDLHSFLYTRNKPED